MATYTYRGPVLYFNKVMVTDWTGETNAISEVKAISNLKYQFKKQNKMVAGIGGIAFLGTIQIKKESFI